jgi:hypothetical protein
MREVPIEIKAGYEERVIRGLKLFPHWYSLRILPNRRVLERAHNKYRWFFDKDWEVDESQRPCTYYITYKPLAKKTHTTFRLYSKHKGRKRDVLYTVCKVMFNETIELKLRLDDDKWKVFVKNDLIDEFEAPDYTRSWVLRYTLDRNCVSNDRTIRRLKLKKDFSLFVHSFCDLKLSEAIEKLKEDQREEEVTMNVVLGMTSGDDIDEKIIQEKFDISESMSKLVIQRLELIDYIKNGKIT